MMTDEDFSGWVEVEKKLAAAVRVFPASFNACNTFRDMVACLNQAHAVVTHERKIRLEAARK